MTAMMVLPASAVEDLVMNTGGDGDGDDNAVPLDGKVTMITWSTLLPWVLRIVFLFLSPPPQLFCGGLDEEGGGVGPLDDEV